MWYRCYNPTHKSYKNYVNSIIHDDFRIFSNYLSWVMNQPNFDEFCSTCHEISWTIEKDIDGNIHYYPQYMSLATRFENNKDRWNRCGSPSSSLDARKKISKANKKPIIGISSISVLLFNSSVDAENTHGFLSKKISACINKRKLTYQGYKWYRINYKHGRILRYVK